MRTIRLLLLLPVGAILLALTTQSHSQPAPKPVQRHAEGELLVKFAGGARGQAAERARVSMRHEVKHHFDFIGWQHIRLPRRMTVDEGLARYRNLPGVEAVEPNVTFDGSCLIPSAEAGRLSPAEAPSVPNDPMFSQQYALERIGATNAWQVSSGSSNVVVAILSTGVNYNHEELTANLWRNPWEIPGNGIDDDANGYVDDIYGIDTIGDGSVPDADPMDAGHFYSGFGQVYHGTINAGIIGAAGNNGLGIAGVNWSIRLMALRFFATDLFRASDAIESLDYIHLMKERGVNVRVVHLAYFADSAFASQAMREAHERIAAQGIFQVTVAQPAVVDHDVSPTYPAAFQLPGMISVATSDQTDNLAAGSGYGRTSMELVAPGIDIIAPSGASPNSYFTYPGTDASGAHVAGAAALLFAIAPKATADDVKAALLETVDVLPSLEDKVATSGRLNVGNAVYHPRIVSNALRFTSIRRLDDGSVRLTIESLASVEVILETSIDLVDWMAQTTLMVDRQTEYTDDEARMQSPRFYRLATPRVP